MAERERLLIDRALLLSALIGKTDGQAERLLVIASGPYRALLYEGAGASGIEAALRTHEAFTGRLVVVGDDAADVAPKERELLRATLASALTDATILSSLQRYQVEAHAVHRDRAEILGYVVRLLLLARRLRADLLPWPERAPMLVALFAAAGVRGSLAPTDGGLMRLEYEPCEFPHLPPRPSGPNAHRFGLLVDPQLVAERQLLREAAAPRTSPGGRSIFVSYSHRDRRWLESLTTMLRPLIRDGSLELWSDEQIRSGADWRSEIASAIDRCAVAVLLVSANFLASDFIAAHELSPLLEAAESRGTSIMWIPISDSLFTRTPLARYQAAHDPSTPLDRLPVARRQQALARIAEQIAELAGEAATPNG